MGEQDEGLCKICGGAHSTGACQEVKGEIKNNSERECNFYEETTRNPIKFVKIKESSKGKEKEKTSINTYIDYTRKETFQNEKVINNIENISSLKFIAENAGTIEYKTLENIKRALELAGIKYSKKGESIGIGGKGFDLEIIEVDKEDLKNKENFEKLKSLFGWISDCGTQEEPHETFNTEIDIESLVKNIRNFETTKRVEK